MKIGSFLSLKAVLLSAAFVAIPVPAQAAGDLLVAPTRVVLDGARGTEVILNNIGAETTTYRISLELRRMTADGQLEDVSPEDANITEAAALDMIRYAPRRVTLPPNQPQAIRIGVRPSSALPDGEYRAHLLFRAVPDTQPVSADPAPASGFTIALTPIYGVTIPIIIRQGKVAATAAISNPRVATADGGKVFAFDLARNGNASTYGEIRVTRPGKSEPVLMARGIAVYPEIKGRTVELPISDEVAAALTGPLTVEYRAADDAGGGLIASAQTVLR
ncbi:MAG: molecular chaperone [Parasphingorhabdus sp.]|nr:molecular chaperone [Parasphingorhabdus sp.]